MYEPESILQDFYFIYIYRNNFISHQMRMMVAIASLKTNVDELPLESTSIPDQIKEVQAEIDSFIDDIG